MAKRPRRRGQSGLPWVIVPGSEDARHRLDWDALKADSARLGAAVLRIAEARPWERFDPAEPLCIATGIDRREVCWMTFGETADGPHIYAHRGGEGRYWAMETASGALPYPVYLAWSLTFTARERVPELMRDLMLLARAELRGRYAWPLPETHSPYYLGSPAPPRALPKIATLLFGVMASLAMRESDPAPFRGGRTFVYPRATGDAQHLASAWAVTQQDPPVWAPPDPEPAGFDRLAAERARALPQDQSEAWAIGAVYLPSIVSDPWGRLHRPVLSGCMLSDGSQLLAHARHHRLEMPAQLAVVLQDAIRVQRRRPGAVSVASDIAAAALSRLCEVTGIAVRRVSAHPQLVERLAAAGSEQD